MALISNTVESLLLEHLVKCKLGYSTVTAAGGGNKTLQSRWRHDVATVLPTGTGEAVGTSKGDNLLSSCLNDFLRTGLG